MLGVSIAADMLPDDIDALKAALLASAAPVVSSRRAPPVPRRW